MCIVHCFRCGMAIDPVARSYGGCSSLFPAAGALRHPIPSPTSLHSRHANPTYATPRCTNLNPCQGEPATHAATSTCSPPISTATSTPSPPSSIATKNASGPSPTAPSTTPTTPPTHFKTHSSTHTEWHTRTGPTREFRPGCIASSSMLVSIGYDEISCGPQFLFLTSRFQQWLRAKTAMRRSICR